MSRVKRASNFKLSCSIYGASTFVLDSSVASEPYFIRVGGTDSSANFAEAVSFVRAVDSVPLTISADSVVLPALRHHTTIVLSTGRSETNPTETIALIFGGVANARNVYQMRFGPNFDANRDAVFIGKVAVTNSHEPTSTIGCSSLICPVSNNIMAVIFGGLNDEGVPTNDVFGFDATFVLEDKDCSADWSALVPTGALAPLPRAFHASITVSAQSSSTMVVFGGKGNECDYNDMWMLVVSHEDGSVKWEEVKSVGTVVPAARHGHSLVYNASTNEIILQGGVNYREDAIFDDCWIFDLVNRTWRRELDSSLRYSVAFHSAASYGSRWLVVCGVINGDSTDKCETIVKSESDAISNFDEYGTAWFAPNEIQPASTNDLVRTPKSFSSTGEAMASMWMLEATSDLRSLPLEIWRTVLPLALAVPFAQIPWKIRPQEYLDYRIAPSDVADTLKFVCRGWNAIIQSIEKESGRSSVPRIREFLRVSQSDSDNTFHYTRSRKRIPPHFFVQSSATAQAMLNLSKTEPQCGIHQRQLFIQLAGDAQVGKSTLLQTMSNLIATELKTKGDETLSPSASLQDGLLDYNTSNNTNVQVPVGEVSHGFHLELSMRRSIDDNAVHSGLSLSALVLCFDVNKKESFENLYLTWLRKVTQTYFLGPIFIVGLKIDSVTEDSNPDVIVSHFEATEVARRLRAHGIFYCSSQTGEGIKEMTLSVVRLAALFKLEHNSYLYNTELAPEVVKRSNCSIQ